MSEGKRAYAYYCRECEDYVEAVERRKCWGRYCPNGCDESCALIPDVRPLETENLALRCAVKPQQVAELEAALAERERRIAELERSVEHVRYWYATRHETLWHWAHADKEHRGEYFAIMANGTARPEDAPTYAQMLNQAEWRAKEATVRLAERDRRVAELQGERDRFHDDYWFRVRECERLEAEVEHRKDHELACMQEMAKARRAAQDAQSNRDTLTMLGMLQVDEFTTGSLVKRLYDRCRELEAQLKRALPLRPQDGDKEEG